MLFLEYWLCKELGLVSVRVLRQELTPLEYAEWAVFLRMHAKGEKPYPDQEHLDSQIASIFGGSSRNT